MESSITEEVPKIVNIIVSFLIDFFLKKKKKVELNP